MMIEVSVDMVAVTPTLMTTFRTLVNEIIIEVFKRKSWEAKKSRNSLNLQKVK